MGQKSSNPKNESVNPATIECPANAPDHISPVMVGAQPLPTLDTYFGYGSNMSKEQMVEREVPWSNRYPCAIRNYRLAFNEDGKTKAHANIMKEPGAIVYGIVYDGC